MSKITVETPDVAQNEKAKDQEVWISRGYSDHMVVVGKGKAVRFKDYKVTLDMNNEEDIATSKALKSSGRDGVDIFVLGKPYADSEITKRTDQLKLLRDMDIRQLRAIVSLDEMLQNNVPTNTLDKELLITLILRTKSLRGVK